eukprot:jgi/Mesvir1/5148/Mv15291-RA.1
MSESNGDACFAGEKCRKLGGGASEDGVSKEELLSGANHPCSGSCGKHVHGICTGLFKDPSAEEGAEWMCPECFAGSSKQDQEATHHVGKNPRPPLPAGINFNAPVSEDDLARMVDLHSNLGGKGKVAGDKKDRDDKNDSDDKMVDSGDDDPASRGAHLGSSDLTGDNSIDNVMESTPADERGKGPGFSRSSELEDAKMTLKFPSPDPPVLKTMPVQGRNESTISVGGGVPGFRAECGIMARAVVNLHPWRQNVGIILGGWKNKTMSALLARETKNSSYKSLLCSFTPSMTRPAPTGIHFHNQVALIVANNRPKWCDVPGVTFPGKSIPANAWNDEMQECLTWAQENEPNLVALMGNAPVPSILLSNAFPQRATMDLCGSPDTPSRERRTQDTTMTDAAPAPLTDITNHGLGRAKRITAKQAFQPPPQMPRSASRRNGARGRSRCRRPCPAQREYQQNRPGTVCAATGTSTRMVPAGPGTGNRAGTVDAATVCAGTIHAGTSNCSRGMVPTATRTGDISGCRLAAASLDDIGMAAGTIAATSLLLTVFM